MAKFDDKYKPFLGKSLRIPDHVPDTFMLRALHCAIQTDAAGVERLAVFTLRREKFPEKRIGMGFALAS